MKILVVDDNAKRVERMVTYLRSKGFIIVACLTYEEGKRILLERHDEFNCIILDRKFDKYTVEDGNVVKDKNGEKYKDGIDLFRIIKKMVGISTPFVFRPTKEMKKI